MQPLCVKPSGEGCSGQVMFTSSMNVQELLDTETSCDKSEMLEALEEIFLLQYKLQANPTQTLVSGLTYEEYHNAHLQLLYIAICFKPTPIPLPVHMR